MPVEVDLQISFQSISTQSGMFSFGRNFRVAPKHALSFKRRLWLRSRWIFHRSLREHLSNRNSVVVTRAGVHVRVFATENVHQLLLRPVITFRNSRTYMHVHSIMRGMRHEYERSRLYFPYSCTLPLLSFSRFSLAETIKILNGTSLSFLFNSLSLSLSLLNVVHTWHLEP